MMQGVCYVKEEYLVKKSVNVEDPIPADVKPDGEGLAESHDAKNENDESGEPPAKKLKLSRSEKRKLKKGQNKHRPAPHKERRENNLCKNYYNGPTDNKCKFEHCKYIHDVDSYLANKPHDIAPTCHIYSTRGFCSWGVTCRAAKSHLDENRRNIKLREPEVDFFNQISYDLQMSLRKRKYDFEKSKAILKRFKSANSKVKGESVESVESVESQECCKSSEPDAPDTAADCEQDTMDQSNVEEPKRLGYSPDFDVIKLRKGEKKRIDFRDKLFLSPLTTVGNLPFRRICKEYGADITCGEMACSVPIINGVSPEWALAKRHKSEDIFGVQLCGNNADLITYAAQVLEENCELDFIDLNIGCPIDLIYKQGGGSALIRRPNVLEAIIRGCSTVLNETPFTVKTRTGVYKDKNVAHELVPKFEEWGAQAVTVHGRSREQRYMKRADWQYIEECAGKLKKIPLIGNGDILSYEDFLEAKKVAPSVSSVMLGRGPLIKPWVFKEIKEGKPWDPSSKERLEIMQKYVNYGLEHWGSDTKGVENTRRFLLEWQSFLHRYVPYGILANPPQRLNERPIPYKGRDELETLLASENCSDWIKLSEMFLGPVPDNFNFLPKHKANSFQVYPDVPSTVTL